MNLLQFKHPDISHNPFTTLSQQANSGDTVLNVVDGGDFAVSTRLLLGSYENDSAEFCTVASGTAPTDAQITLAVALGMNHTTDTPVIWVDYDQIEVSSATAKGGSYSIIATINITPDEKQTIYRDSAGTVTTYYKIRYKNSVTGAFSGYSAEIPATGFLSNTFIEMQNAVIRQFGSQSEKILDIDDVKKWINEGYRKMVLMIVDQNNAYYSKYGTDGNGATIALVANQRTYACPSDWVKTKRLAISYDGQNKYFADPMDPEDDDPLNVYVATDPKYYMEGTNIVPRPLPTSSVGWILPIYNALPPDMVADDDQPNLPIGYQDNPVNYALKKAFQRDSKADWVQYYDDEFKNNNTDMMNWTQDRTPEIPKFIGMFGTSVEQDYFDGFNPPIN